MRLVDCWPVASDGASIQCLAAVGIATILVGDEAGSLHVGDCRSKAVASSSRLGTAADDSVNCVCADPTSRNDTAYAAVGKSIHQVDLRNLSSTVATYTFSSDDVNALAISRGRLAATADDNGEVKLIDLASGRLRHSFPAAHTCIASCAAFHGTDDSQLLTGGFDCRVVKWDVARRKARDKWQMDTDGAADTMMCNPPFVHALAVPSCGGRPLGHYAAVARGDGLVEVFDVDNPIGKRQKRGGLLGLAVQLGREAGGHTRAATAVCFPGGGEGKLVVSGGDDRRLCCWDWVAAAAPGAGGPATGPGSGGPAVENGSGATDRGPLLSSAVHGAKLNCVLGGETAEAGQGGCWVGDVDGAVSWYLLQ